MQVCDLREKRLDEEDMITEFQKTIEVLRKEKETLAKKQKLVEQGLQAVNSVGAREQWSRAPVRSSLNSDGVIRNGDIQANTDAFLYCPRYKGSAVIVVACGSTF